MSSLQTAIQNLAKVVVEKSLSTATIRLVGLGSGSTVSFIVKEIGKLANKNYWEFLPTSLQIKLEAEKSGLRIADDSHAPEIDILFDGADQIDSQLYMIKGGGGALLREKILIYAAKKIVIVADSSKFVKVLTRPVPIEIHPFARNFVSKKLSSIGGQVKLRTMEKGYPYITENGNLILDTELGEFSDVKMKEAELKNIPGVLEVGLFTRRADVYYKSKGDGSFEIITT